MPEQKLESFLEAVKNDAALQEKLKAAVGADDVVAIAKQAGFTVVADEIRNIRTEISEEELEGVAGGSILCWNWHF